jgi:TonB family protein
MIIRALVVAASLLIGSLRVAAVPQDVVYDDDVTLVSFAETPYPAIAASARIEGDVVVTVALSDDGSVKDAVALSGPRLLVPTAIDNARKWRFVSNRQRRAVIVYEFRLSFPCVRGEFRVLRPNVAWVGGCKPSSTDGIVRPTVR